MTKVAPLVTTMSSLIVEEAYVELSLISSAEVIVENDDADKTISMIRAGILRFCMGIPEASRKYTILRI